MRVFRAVITIRNMLKHSAMQTIPFGNNCSFVKWNHVKMQPTQAKWYNSVSVTALVPTVGLHSWSLYCKLSKSRIFLLNPESLISMRFGEDMGSSPRCMTRPGLPECVEWDGYDALWTLLGGESGSILQRLIGQRRQVEATLVGVAQPWATRHRQHLQEWEGIVNKIDIRTSFGAVLEAFVNRFLTGSESIKWQLVFLCYWLRHDSHYLYIDTEGPRPIDQKYIYK